MSIQPNPLDIVNYLRRVAEPGMIIELRMLGVVDDPRYPKFVVSGYYDHNHLNELAQHVVQGNWIAQGVYVTINPVDTALLARSANRLTRKPENTTKDTETLRRTGLVFDFDPVRPAGVSATDGEKALAGERLTKCSAFLASRGWPDQIISDSGNGYHARYRIDLANNAGSSDLVKRVLEAADALFSDETVKVDVSLSNASRIIKLPGTLARKGDSTPDRPHRLAKLLFVPEDFKVVPVELLEAFANDHRPEAKPAAGKANEPIKQSAKKAKADSGTGVFYPKPGIEVFDDFTAKTDWLSPDLFGEVKVDRTLSDGEIRLTRPGKDDGPSGSIGYEGRDVFHCFSDNWPPFEVNGTYNKFQVYTYLHHGGNEAAAAKTLSALGFGTYIDHDGTEKENPPPADWPSLKPPNEDRRSGGGSKATATEGDDDSPIPTPPWPAPLNPAAYHGLAGEIVRAIEPHTEADPAALLVQLLVGFGNAIGHNPYVVVGRKWHHCSENAVLVGLTSSGRKGTAWTDVKCFLAAADDVWCKTRIVGGLSSGEGLIHAVRDALEGKVPIKDKGKILRYEDAIIEPGVDDKRLLTLESEFGGVLQALARDGNRLSSVIRQAWDGDTLATLTKSSPHRATDSHISIIGHITFAELIQLLSECDQANGFSNRILWVCTQRSKLLPRGGFVPQDDVDRLSKKLAKAVSFARHAGRVQWSDAALELWDAAYPGLTASRPGAWGHATSRAEAHATRLAMLYALLDDSNRIEPNHLLAALALWDYSERSAAHIFGDKLGDKDADAILGALRSTSNGMTRTEINRTVFRGNKAASVIASKLGILRQHGLARSEATATAGRTSERWFSVPTKYELDELNEKSLLEPKPNPSLKSSNSSNSYFAESENGSLESTIPTEREVFEL